MPRSRCLCSTRWTCLLPTDVPAVVKSLSEIAVARRRSRRRRSSPVSARTGDGIAALRVALGDLAAARSAARRPSRGRRRDARRQRCHARHRVAGRHPRCRAAGRGGGRGRRYRVVASALARSYRKRSAQATGWPIVSWISRLRADPLTRLGLGTRGKDRDPAVHRTSLPAMSSAASAKLSLAVRGFADAASDGLAGPWRSAIRTRAEGAIDAPAGRRSTSRSRARSCRRADRGGGRSSRCCSGSPCSPVSSGRVVARVGRSADDGSAADRDSAG